MSSRSTWIATGIEQKAQAYAIASVVPEHVEEVRRRRVGWVEKTRAPVKDRLTKEIAHWDHRASLAASSSCRSASFGR